MKAAAQIILHYGADYLPYAIQCVYDAVDEVVIVYSPSPTHGTQTNIPCPETEQQLKDAAFSYDPDKKIKWETVTRFTQESQHRDYALWKCQEAGADLVLVLDADEVWPTYAAFTALNIVWNANKAHNWLLNFRTMWRSFSWSCTDHLWPVRIKDLRHPVDSSSVAYLPMEEIGDVYHMGYAIRSSLLKYKVAGHGHIGQWRKDWYETKWKAWPPVPDCHPTDGNNTWVPEPFNPRLLPLVLWGHSFWGLDPIP